MNVATLLIQQTTQLGHNRTKSSNEGQSVFGSLLQSIGSKLDDSLIISQAQLSTREHLASTEEDNSIEALFSAYLAGDEASLKPLLEQLNVKGDALTTITEESQSLRIVALLEKWLTSESDTDISDKMTRLSSQIEQAVEQLSTNLTKSDSDVVVLELVEEWMTLKGDTDISDKMTRLWIQIEQSIEQLSTDLTKSDIDLAVLGLVEEWMTLKGDTDISDKMTRLSNQMEEAVEQQSTDPTKSDKDAVVLELVKEWMALKGDTDISDKMMRLWNQMKESVEQQSTDLSKSIPDAAVLELVEDWMALKSDTDISDKMTHLWNQIGDIVEQQSIDLTKSVSNVAVLDLVNQWLAVSDEAPEQSSKFLAQKDNTELAKWLENSLSNLSVTEKNTTSTQSNGKIASLEQLFQSKTLLDVDVIQQQSIEKLVSIWKQVEQVVAQISSGKLDQESNVKILKLLEQWAALEKSAPQETAKLLQDKKATNEGQLWSRLLGTYQKRTEGQMQVKYKSNALVTTTDVSKWVKNAVNSLSSEVKTTVATSNVETLATGQQISKIEQFVVHVKQSTQTNQKTTANNLMEEFQNVIKSSKFMSGPNGTNQLILKLRPNHLGDISVRLTQVNGQMMVKITATTQAAKDALETNIQQLRHMFSPNQVTIEKQDAQTFQQTTEESNRSFDDQMSESSQQEDADGKEHSDSEQDQGSISFEEVLMNERV